MFDLQSVAAASVLPSLLLRRGTRRLNDLTLTPEMNSQQLLEFDFHSFLLSLGQTSARISCSLVIPM